MSSVQRILIGATGGLLAILTKFLSQDQEFVSHWDHLHDSRFYDIVLGYAILTPILIFLGGAVAGFSDETNKLKLLAMGLAAPALITTMAGGVRAPISQPIAPHTVGPAGWYFPLPAINTALAADARPTTISQATAIERGVGAFFGAGKGEIRYWVIAGSFKDKSAAEALANSINKQDPSMKAFVGKRIPGNEFYPVIVGDFSTLEDARKLQDSASHLKGLDDQPYLSAFPDRHP
jgi:hypothetical protein